MKKPIQDPPIRISDDDSRELDAWLEAFEDVDKRGDLAAIKKLILNDAPRPTEARKWLADLIERLHYRGPGRPRTPAYAVSDKEITRLYAMTTMDAFRERGIPFDEAVARVKKMFSPVFDVRDEYRRTRGNPW